MPFGLPDSPNILLVVLQKGYVTSELFLKLVNEILLPEAELRRAKFGLPNSQCLLILDGATQHHSFEAREALTRANIQVHFLVPHLSHLTQPLDCLFFKIFKSEL